MMNNLSNPSNPINIGMRMGQHNNSFDLYNLPPVVFFGIMALILIFILGVVYYIWYKEW